MPDLTWLAWKNGNTKQFLLEEGASKAKDEGEKVPVYLKIVNFGQYDKSEKLKKVLRKKATEFEEYLGHGVVPLVNAAGRGDDFKDQLKRQMQGEEKPIQKGTVAEKVRANAPETTF